jgi:ribosomal-protein-alanine N-acetyltransferase
MLLRTKRLDLLPCSFQVAQAVVQDRDGLKSLLGVQVPDNWPAQDLQEFLPTYAQQLQADPSLLGWGTWLMIHRAERTVIGDLGFKGRPDDEGTVEIGYSVLPAYRRQGFASEAVRALVDWALAQQGVRGIVAECNADNTPSIHVLEKVGMQRLETGGTLLRWEVRNKRACAPQ